LYGVAVAGEQGAGQSLDLLAQELRLAMTLLGSPDIHTLNRSQLFQRSYPHSPYPQPAVFENLQ
jgi:(S)-mandelate dehydrogenase